MRKGVREVLSPALFNPCMMDFNEELEKRGIRGVALCNIRTHYDIQMTIYFKLKTAFVDMMDALKSFLKERILELCTEKTKIIVFNGKEKKNRDM